MSRNYPNLMTNLKQAELQRVIDLGHLLMSPRLDQNGSRVGFIVLSKEITAAYDICKNNNY